MKKFSLILSIITLLVLAGCLNNLFKSGEWDKEGGTVYCEKVEVGETKKIDKKEYTAVDRKILEDWIKKGKDLSKACTSNIKDMSGRIKWDEEKNTRIGIEGLFEIWKSGVPKPNTVLELKEFKKGFNENIASWDVSNVENMSWMFYDTEKFNQDIGNWDVSNVENMVAMFYGAKKFNQDIGDWDVSNAVDMSSIFRLAKSFNQDIGDWNVNNVKDISYMFNGAKSFNQDIGDWDVSKVKDMRGMFRGAKLFNQNISEWDVSNVKECYIFNKESPLSKEHIPEFENCDIDKSPY